MAVMFLEPGGDADFLINAQNGFWGTISATAPNIATDFVHGTHQKSISFVSAIGSVTLATPTGTVFDAGTRVSVYLYITTLPTSLVTTFYSCRVSAAGATVINLRITSAGVLQLWNGTTAQIGSNGATLSISRWYRISLAYTVTSTSVNRFELFVDGASSVSVTNATIPSIGSSVFLVGTISANTGLNFRMSDVYIDNSSSLTDTGDVWITAKRPFANGNLNEFTTQVGAGGSGYGSGHSPQVNERPLSATNAWSVLGAGSILTEEYTIEPSSAGDMDISGNTLVDYLGWVSVKSTISETATLVVGGNTSTYATSTTDRLTTLVTGSSVYPSGGTDIGIKTDTAVTTLTLEECGLIFAFLGPPVSAANFVSTLSFLGAG